MSGLVFLDMLAALFKGDDDDVEIVQHDTGVEVRSGTISAHLGHNKVIDVEVNGKNIYAGFDAREAGDRFNQARRVNKLYKGG